MDIYSHGTGSSCGGNEFHHEVIHLVENGITLCGVVVRGERRWWREYSIRQSEFVPDESYQKPQLFEKVICQRCAKARAKRLKENGRNWL